MDFTGNGQECPGRSMTADPRLARSKRVLILVRAEDEGVRGLLHSLENPESGGVGVVMEHVGAGPNQSNGRFTTRGDVVEGVEVGSSGSPPMAESIWHQPPRHFPLP